VKTFSQIPDTVILSDKISDKAFRFYCKLKKFEHLHTKKCNPTYEQLGMRRDIGSKCVKELEYLGILRVERRHKEPNRYSLGTDLSTLTESLGTDSRTQTKVLGTDSRTHFIPVIEKKEYTVIDCSNEQCMEERSFSFFGEVSNPEIVENLEIASKPELFPLAKEKMDDGVQISTEVDLKPFTLSVKIGYDEDRAQFLQRRKDHLKLIRLVMTQEKKEFVV
jgi:hypothetical protein